jgi:hypothetical protein
VVVQGDLRAAIAYMRYAGRMRRPAVADLLSELRVWTSANWRATRFTHLPREVNQLADFLAGVGRTEKLRALTERREAATLVPTLPPHLLRANGFITHGVCPSGTPFLLLQEAPSLRFLDLAEIARARPEYAERLRDYLAALRAFAGSLPVGYTTRSDDGLGRAYAVGVAAQTLPRIVRLALYGHDHWELDLAGCFYELVRRGAELPSMPDVLPVLPHVGVVRGELVRLLHGHCAPDEAPSIAKRAIQHALNTGGQEASRSLQREFPLLPAAFKNLLLDIGFAADKVAGYLRECKGFQRTIPDNVRNRNFRTFEHVESVVMGAFLSFLRQRCDFTSVIWLHDGIWVLPPPPTGLIAEALAHAFAWAGLRDGVAGAMKVVSLAEERSDCVREARRALSREAPGNPEPRRGESVTPRARATFDMALSLRQNAKRHAPPLPDVRNVRRRTVRSDIMVQTLHKHFRRTQAG